MHLMPADLSIGINKQRSTNGKGVEMSLDTARTSACPTMAIMSAA